MTKYSCFWSHKLHNQPDPSLQSRPSLEDFVEITHNIINEAHETNNKVIMNHTKHMMKQTQVYLGSMFFGHRADIESIFGKKLDEVTKLFMNESKSFGQSGHSTIRGT